MKEFGDRMFAWSKVATIECVAPNLNPEAVQYLQEIQETWNSLLPEKKPKTIYDLSVIFGTVLVSVLCTPSLAMMMNFIMGSISQYYYTKFKV